MNIPALMSLPIKMLMWYSSCSWKGWSKWYWLRMGAVWLWQRCSFGWWGDWRLNFLRHCFKVIVLCQTYYDMKIDEFWDSSCALFLFMFYFVKGNSIYIKASSKTLLTWEWPLWYCIWFPVFYFPLIFDCLIIIFSTIIHSIVVTLCFACPSYNPQVV